MMARPILLDTDMGVDDAFALALAVSSPELEVVGIATVGGNVPVEQAAANAARCLGALGPGPWPPIGRGLDQPEADLSRAAHVFGEDGLGNTDLPVPTDQAWEDALGLCERALAEHSGRLALVCLGPLTNTAALLKRNPGWLARADRIIAMGGALFCPGNVTPKAEFNVYRDPQAAAQVLGSGLPITLVPLDVTRQVAIDESHVARLAASGSRAGRALARMIEYPLARGSDGAPGRFPIHDAVALGVLLWPELYLQTQMAVQVRTDGPDRGRTTPAVGRKDLPRVCVILSVQVADLLENMLERMCRESFVV